MQDTSTRRTRTKESARAARNEARRWLPAATQWTDDEILDLLRAASSELDGPLTINSFTTWAADNLIPAPAERTLSTRFGSWTSACERAGVEAGRKGGGPAPSASPQECLGALRAFITECEAENVKPSIDRYEATSGQRGWPSRNTIRLRVGRWTEAVEQARLLPADMAPLERERPRGGQERTPDWKILHGIRRYLSTNPQRSSFQDYNRWAASEARKGRYVVKNAVARARFGRWKHAAERAAAGLSEVEVIEMLTDAAAGRPALGRRKFTEWAAANDAPDLGEVLAVFPTWEAACSAAGLHAPRQGRPRRYTDAELLAAVSDAAAAWAPEPLDQPRYETWRTVERSDAPTSAALHGRFGSWVNALRRAGAG